jgi:hypothetical protein
LIWNYGKSRCNSFLLSAHAMPHPHECDELAARITGYAIRAGCSNPASQLAQGGHAVCKTVVSDTVGSIPSVGIIYSAHQLSDSWVDDRMANVAGCNPAVGAYRGGSNPSQPTRPCQVETASLRGTNAESSNGRTEDFESSYLGSNPSSASVAHVRYSWQLGVISLTIRSVSLSVKLPPVERV